MKNIYIKPRITQIFYTKDDILSQSLTNLGVVNEECDYAIWTGMQE